MYAQTVKNSFRPFSARNSRRSPASFGFPDSWAVSIASYRVKLFNSSAYSVLSILLGELDGLVVFLVLSENQG